MAEGGGGGPDIESEGKFGGGGSFPTTGGGILAGEFKVFEVLREEGGGRELLFSCVDSSGAVVEMQRLDK